MPTLQELKDKWFIDVSIFGEFPPQTRHPGTQVQPHTDGNLVTPLIDGKCIMEDFSDRVDEMINEIELTNNDELQEIWIASHHIDQVKMLGAQSNGMTVIEKILEAAATGIRIHYLGSGHPQPSLSDITLLLSLLQTATTGGGPEAFGDQDAYNLIAALERRGNGNTGTIDFRLPFLGSHHQKFVVYRQANNGWVAVVSSADFSFNRWDTRDHFEQNDDREDNPTHDLAVRVVGPAVHDIALTFVERWNDQNSLDRTFPRVQDTISTGFLDSAIPPAGPHSVQVLRTYATNIHSNWDGYSWSHQGEFTIWAAYLNAIQKAQNYIYIEDQYFYSFNYPPPILSPYIIRDNDFRNTDLVYNLGEKIKEGVDVVIVTPYRSEDFGSIFQAYQRALAINYLDDIASVFGGRFSPCYIEIGVEPTQPMVHSKIMIVDDEFALIGSANFNQRSMANDSEIHLGIVDENNLFCRDLRMNLWREHLELLSNDEIDDPQDGIQLFPSMQSEEIHLLISGRLRLLPTGLPNLAAYERKQHPTMLNKIIDPYSGPERI